MNIKDQIKKISSNRVFINQKMNYSVILGLNVSNGARSPKLWNRAYKSLGIEAKMFAIDVSPNKIFDLLNALKEDEYFSGGAIAAPYKEYAASFLGTNLTREASDIGAINCIFRSLDGTLYGTNTDGEGALKAFENEFGKVDNRKTLILGVGGTGKAVAAYFSSAVSTLDNLSVSSRSNSAANLAKVIGCKLYDWNELPKVIQDQDLIINCTSLGSSLMPDLMPLSKECVSSAQKSAIIYDVIYKPFPTRLLNCAESVGLKNLSGQNMNFEQAVAAFNYVVSKGRKDSHLDKVRIAMS